MGRTLMETVQDIRTAAIPLLRYLPTSAWLPHAMIPKPGGKWDKPPRGGATTSNPASWYTIDNALALLSGNNDIAGVGFAISRGIIGLDYDMCRDPETGVLTPSVQAELERIDSYAYVTPSGKGIRIVGTNNTNLPIPGGKKNRFLPCGQKIELFIGPTNHFNTFTSETILGYDTIRDITSETLDYLAGLPGSDREATSDTVSSGPHERSIDAIRAALVVIPNQRQDWDEWCRIGMATWRSSGGTQDGLQAWMKWSSKHPAHDDAACEERWAHWFRSPPTKIGFGTLYHLAREANPLFVAPYDSFGDTLATPPPLTIEQAVTQATEASDDDVFQTLDIDALSKLPPVEWLLDGILTTDGFGVTYGPPGSLKSFLLIAWALHVASGKPWMNRPVVQGGVLYIAGEGVRGMARRIKAWMRANDVEGVDLPFRLLPTSVNLNDPAQMAKLIRTAHAAAAVEGVKIALTVIDTVARAIPGADENSSQDMGRFVAAVDFVKSQIGGHLHGVHHSGKDAEKGARGSSALLGAVDTMVQVKRDGERMTVRIEKQKDDDEGKPIALKTEQVDLSDGLKVEKSLILVSDENGGSDSHNEAAVNLGQIANCLGKNGTNTVRAVAIALGVTPGRASQAMAARIPFYPDYATVELPDATVRLSRVHLGDGKHTVNINRYDLS